MKDHSRPYRKYDQGIQALKEAAESDKKETQRVIDESRLIRQKSEERQTMALVHTNSLPDFSRALSHQSGGGVMLRPARSPPASPYQRSPSSSPVRTPSPKRVTLSHRDQYKHSGAARRKTLEIPDTVRQRSHSDSNISYVTLSSPEVVMVPVMDQINTSTYTSPQTDLLPQRVPVIQRSPSINRRNTVGYSLQPPDFTVFQLGERKTSLPAIIVSDHDTGQGVVEHIPVTTFNPDTPESDNSSAAGELFQDVLQEEVNTVLTDIDPEALENILENIQLNSPQPEDQTPHLTTLTSHPPYYFPGGFVSPAQAQGFSVNVPMPGEEENQDL